MVTTLSFVEAGQPVENGLRVGLGVRCHVGGNALSESVMYRVNDLAKAGVPQVSSMQNATIRTIRRYVSGPELWFTLKPSFIVFIAGAGSPICGEGAAKLILNGGCNEAFSPTSETDVFFETDCGDMPARPWVRADATVHRLKPDPSYWKHAADR